MNISLPNMNATEMTVTANFSHDCRNTSDYSKCIITTVMLIICFIGIPLNGIVIWLLGFQIKRNPFTVLILNLAIADFGLLLCMSIYYIDTVTGFISSKIPWYIFFSLLHIMYLSGMFLLTAISIDRCVAVLFPIWHRCSRPKSLSSAICAFLWIFSFLLIGMLNITQHVFKYRHFSLDLVVTVVLCVPLITISTVIVFTKMGFKSKQMKRRRLLLMILITLLCFLILTLPLDIFVFITHFFRLTYWLQHGEFDTCFNLCSSLNCSVNPVIYFLVGRKKRLQSRENVKVIFQRIFKEEEAPET
ncbi:mas-related G-protein coupled receptor member H-like [Crotalus tigris]|uniref:mas-related G-protein coupled receptor member H-like n=1 Tax=Crotalus tigris TaxID=88082 RepID=UPI00192F6BA3|nr:mas-related G-protein coupled receptor member H-like [Crotalus tigris]